MSAIGCEKKNRKFRLTIDWNFHEYRQTITEKKNPELWQKTVEKIAIFGKQLWEKSRISENDCWKNKEFRQTIAGKILNFLPNNRRKKIVYFVKYHIKNYNFHTVMVKVINFIKRSGKIANLVFFKKTHKLIANFVKRSCRKKVMYGGKCIVELSWNI